MDKEAWKQKIQEVRSIRADLVTLEKRFVGLIDSLPQPDIDCLQKEFVVMHANIIKAYNYFDNKVKGEGEGNGNGGSNEQREDTAMD